jgi:hypothetical protein
MGSLTIGNFLGALALASHARTSKSGLTVPRPNWNSRMATRPQGHTLYANEGKIRG